MMHRSGLKMGMESGFASGFWCNSGAEKWIEIGNSSGMAYDGKIICNRPVVIRDFVTMAAGVTLINWTGEDNLAGATLEIENSCWIGAGVTIFGGVKIGRFAVVGAGAWVDCDVPPQAIVVGRPAKLVRYRKVPEKIWYGPSRYLDTKTFLMQKIPQES